MCSSIYVNFLNKLLHIKNVDSFTDKLKASIPSLTYLSMLGNQACPNELLASDKDEEDYQRFR